MANGFFVRSILFFLARRKSCGDKQSWQGMEARARACSCAHDGHGEAGDALGVRELLTGKGGRGEDESHARTAPLGPGQDHVFFYLNHYHESCRFGPKSGCEIMIYCISLSRSLPPEV